MEFWIRFDGQRGCFVGFGHEPNNGCNGCHFEGAHCHATPLLLLACAAARVLTVLTRACEQATASITSGTQTTCTLAMEAKS